MTMAVDTVRVPPPIRELSISKTESQDDVKDRLSKLEGEVKALKKRLKGMAATLGRVESMVKRGRVVEIRGTKSEKQAKNTKNSTLVGATPECFSANPFFNLNPKLIDYKPTVYLSLPHVTSLLQV